MAPSHERSAPRFANVRLRQLSDEAISSVSSGNNCISAVTLASGGLSANGNLYTVSGGVSHDVRGVIFDPINNTWYYGTAGDGATNGDFGTVVFNDVTHTATLTVLLSNVPAHGLTFDPFTNDIIFSSAGLIEQFQPGVGVVSTVNFGGAFVFNRHGRKRSSLRCVERRATGFRRLRRHWLDRDGCLEEPVLGGQSG